jgi:CubicO group peptidase (beta-lactamase class C family)
MWLNPASVSVAVYNELSHIYKDVKKNVWITRTLPKDAYFMSGFHGQFVIVIPSIDCVIARLGVTPDDATGDGDPDWANLKFSRPLFFGTLAHRCQDISRMS